MVSHSRSLTGCAACRARHLKCDETRPNCQMCQITGIECPGYNGQIKWPVDGAKLPRVEPDSPEKRVFRRPLYQGVEQQSMVQLLVDSLGRNSANTALGSIDRWLDSPSGPNFFQGPFGVMDFQGDRLNDYRKIHDTPQPTRSGPSQSSCHSLETESFTDYTNTIADETHTNANELHVGPTPSPAEILYDGNLGSRPDGFDQTALSTNSSTPCPLPISTPIPPRAPELLRHFKDHVISFSFPLRGNPNCPWKTVHLPTAMAAYADILVGNKASHTSLSLLHSILSASCLHRATRLRNAQEYESLRISNHHLAKQHLQLGLEEEMTGKRPVKYKELLMSILSMVVLEISAKSYNEAQELLVEAECLIRRRGLPKSCKSSKVRAIHHVYTWLRIMAESTCGCALVRVCPARPNSSLVADEGTKQSLRSFRLSDAASLIDLDMNIQKDDTVGHYDIHLELMGAWTNTLFPNMYGVPESLMGLLSQTIRLANEQELLTRDTIVDADVVTNLNKRTKTLEHHILSWETRMGKDSCIPFSPLSRGAGTKNQHEPAPLPSYNALAMHQSLILFYYRRVHNINAIILQETVKKAMRFIEQACGSNEREEHNASLLWPCFIAASEALDRTVQDRLLHWLRDMLDRTAVQSFAVAADVIQCVWRARQERGDFTLSWFDVLGHDRCPIIAI